MRLLTTFLLTIFITNSVKAFENDKGLHFTGAMFATSTIGMVFRQSGYSKTWSAINAALIVNTLGLWKESNDSHFDQGDIRHNIYGTIVGVSIIYAF